MAFGNYSYNPYAWSNPYAAQQYPTQMQPTPQQNNGIRWVQGEAGMKAYPLAPGESAFLMDTENPMGYLKSVDMNGMPSARYFSITEINPPALARENAPKTGYATLEELAMVRDDIGKLHKAVQALQAAAEGKPDE